MLLQVYLSMHAAKGYNVRGQSRESRESSAVLKTCQDVYKSRRANHCFIPELTYCIDEILQC